MVKLAMDKKIRTRFAPSPTGFLHIGGLRTALYAYALAKHSEGDFILRIEDTDQKREVEGAVEALKSTLAKFGLVHDEIYTQSLRLEMYRKAAEKLVKDGVAFYCDCKPKNAKDEGFSIELRDPCRDSAKTSGAIKLKVPQEKTLSYFDFVHRKEISWDSDTVYDATLLKSDGYPTYHLAVAVDDLDMQITHLLRGHDWLPSTPIHLLVFEYLGGERPEIGHLTDILSADTGKKLSKRRDSVFVEQFLEEGYLPEALLNFVMLLGWAPKDNREMFTLEEFVKAFDINGFQEANPKFLRNKLDWFNGEYIRQMPDAELYNRVLPVAGENWDKEKIRKMVPLTKERMRKISEFNSLTAFVFEEKPPVNLIEHQEEFVASALQALNNVEDWTLENINNALMETVKAKGYKTGDFFMALRGALAGSKVTPPLNESMEIIGKEGTILRLQRENP
jgi:glutamyl-tRNA synthetase